MRVISCILLFALASLAHDPAAEAASAKRTVRLALVVGNNQPDPQNANEARLRFADDDALATAALLRDAGVKVWLLTRLDDDTASISDMTPFGPPSWSGLQVAFNEANALLAQAKRRGDQRELLLFFSGHGDVSRGEGYMALEGGRLTRSRLYGQLLRRSHAQRNHVVVDACRAYFLAFAKGPGGRRRRYEGTVAPAAVPGDLKHVGFLLATSSDRSTHEWGRYQAGIFSHELRSGLRGAADVNGDRQISYAELGAFLRRAGSGVRNARYRPDFLLRPPDGSLDQTILAWDEGPDELVVEGNDASATRHFFIENAQGNRLLDAHPARDHTFRLHLGPDRPLFIRQPGATFERVLEARRPITLRELPRRRAMLVERGALQLAFQQLFAVPFRATDVHAYKRWYAGALLEQRPREADEGDETGSGWRSGLATVAGWTAIATSAATVGVGAWTIERYATGQDLPQAERPARNDQIRALTTASVVLISVGLTAAATWAIARWW